MAFQIYQYNIVKIRSGAWQEVIYILLFSDFDAIPQDNKILYSSKHMSTSNDSTLDVKYIDAVSSHARLV